MNVNEILIDDSKKKEEIVNCILKHVFLIG